MRRPRLIDPCFSRIREEMSLMGVDPMGIDIMEEKAKHHLIKVDDVELRAALIVKQNMLSLGGEAALCREAAGLRIDRSPVLLMGTTRQIQELVTKLKGQPFDLAQLSRSIEKLLETTSSPARYMVGSRNILSGGKIGVMGILNLTVDSFSDGGMYVDRDLAVARGIEMASEGADIIDVGGESTRPGAQPVSVEQEMERVIPVIKDLVAEGVKVVSVDTTKAQVAEKAIGEGASIVNDISGMTFDEKMLDMVSDAGASVILMHTRGRPETMQDNLDYDDLMGEVCSSLEGAMDRAVAAGLQPERICLDPGIGFGKSLEQNLEVLARVGEIRSMGSAVMVGASRKSFIGGLTGAEVDDRMAGSVSASVTAALKGADLVRVHDVAEAVQAMAVVSAVKGFTEC